MEKREVTIPQPVLFVLWKLAQASYQAYVVGGAVRDLLMGKETNDWDFTTSANPEELQKLFRGSFYNNTFGMVGWPIEAVQEQMQQEGWETGEDFLTEYQDQVLEITTFRTEVGYSDRRRPDTVSWGKSIEEDLSRRDFTINAIALQTQNNLGGLLAFVKKQKETAMEVTLIDPYNGMGDIGAELIKAVREPKERFEEDALRMLRGIRLGASLGFMIETKTLQAMQEQAALIKFIAWERIRDELLKLLASPYPADGINLMASSGLLEFVMPEMLAMKGVKQAGHHIYDVWTHSLESLRECPSSDPVVRLAALLHDVGKPKTYREQGPRGVTFYGHEVVGSRMAREIGRRLRLPNKEVDRLYILVRWHMFAYDSQMTDAAIRRFIKRVGVPNINDMILLRIGDRKGGGSKATSWRLRELQERIGEQLYEPLSLKDLNINGNEIMTELKLKPGPQVGKILNQLFEEVMEDSSRNEKEWLISRAKELN